MLACDDVDNALQATPPPVLQALRLGDDELAGGRAPMGHLSAGLHFIYIITRRHSRALRRSYMQSIASDPLWLLKQCAGDVAMTQSAVTDNQDVLC
jgi:hypothetical protein